MFLTFSTLSLILREFVQSIFRFLCWTLKEDCHEKLKQDTFLNIKNDKQKSGIATLFFAHEINSL